MQKGVVQKGVVLKEDLQELNRQYQHEKPEALIRRAFQEFGVKKVALASSLSIEDQVLTDLILKVEPKARIFVLDTGRHFQQTYNLMEETARRYNFSYEIYAPASEDVEKMVSKYGPNLFYESVELRKFCCEQRKVKPLKRALSTLEGWICGLRKEQSPTREGVELWEWDEAHGIYKINPLANWSEEEVWDYIRRENVPYNSLYTQGFSSIGCQPCTRSIKPGEDIRSGRWWWESPDKKECGLHR